jgi:hypothetical protein
MVDGLESGANVRSSVDSTPFNVETLETSRLSN